MSRSVPSVASRLVPVAVMVFLLLGCTGSGDEAPAGSADLYGLRGEVVELSGEKSARRRLRVRHREIPDFKNREGEVVGMKAMAMWFDLAEEIDSEDLEVGDQIELTLEVVWSRDPPARIVELAPVPPGSTDP